MKCLANVVVKFSRSENNYGIYFADTDSWGTREGEPGWQTGKDASTYRVLPGFTPRLYLHYRYWQWRNQGRRARMTDRERCSSIQSTPCFHSCITRMGWFITMVCSRYPFIIVYCLYLVQGMLAFQRRMGWVQYMWYHLIILQQHPMVVNHMPSEYNVREHVDFYLSVCARNTLT